MPFLCLALDPLIGFTVVGSSSRDHRLRNRFFARRTPYMWNPNWVQINLWLHVISACIWIGGQITIAMLIPLLRGQPALLTAAARRYQVAAWIAFAVLVVTGVINV